MMSSREYILQCSERIAKTVQSCNIFQYTSKKNPYLSCFVRHGCVVKHDVTLCTFFYRWSVAASGRASGAAAGRRRPGAHQLRTVATDVKLTQLDTQIYNGDTSGGGDHRLNAAYIQNRDQAGDVVMVNGVGRDIWGRGYLSVDVSGGRNDGLMRTWRKKTELMVLTLQREWRRSTVASCVHHS